jgi:hypothetical protein
LCELVFSRDLKCLLSAGMVFQRESERVDLLHVISSLSDEKKIDQNASSFERNPLPAVAGPSPYRSLPRDQSMKS